MSYINRSTMTRLPMTSKILIRVPKQSSIGALSNAELKVLQDSLRVLMRL